MLAGLYVLLDRAGVTKPATELGLTLSAMSKMLERLRAEFGDRLLVRTGNHMLRRTKPLQRCRPTSRNAQGGDWAAGVGRSGLQ